MTCVIDQVVIIVVRRNKMIVSHKWGSIKTSGSVLQFGILPIEITKLHEIWCFFLVGNLDVGSLC